VALSCLLVAGTPARASAATPLFAEEFQGPVGASPDPARWTMEVGGRWAGGQELQQYTDRPENASLDGAGNLAITARAERYTGVDGVTRDYTSARLNTLGKFELQHGVVEARIRMPAGRGLLPAFWALGTDLYTAGWPASGEIDIVEMLGSDPFEAFGTVHGPRGDDQYGLSASLRSPQALSDDFHTYAVEWAPNRISFAIDGRVYAVRTPADVPAGRGWAFEHPFFLLFTLAVGGPWPGAPDASTAFPATMLVDWVRAWPLGAVPFGQAPAANPASAVPVAAPGKPAKGARKPARNSRRPARARAACAVGRGSSAAARRRARSRCVTRGRTKATRSSAAKPRARTVRG